MTRPRVLILLLVFVACPSWARAQGFLDFMEQWSGPGPFNYGISVDARIGCKLIAEHNPKELAEVQARRAAAQLARGVAKAATKPDDDEKEERPFGSWFHRDSEMVHALDGDRMVTKHPCAVRSKDVVAFFEARFAHASTDIHPLFADRPSEFVGHTNSYMVQGLVMRQIIDPAFAVGIGGGVVWFGGETIDRHPTRLLLTPLAVDITPIRLFKPNWGRWARAVVFHFEESAFVGSVSAKDFNSASTSPYESHAEVFRSFAVNLDWTALLFDK